MEPAHRSQPSPNGPGEAPPPRPTPAQGVGAAVLFFVVYLLASLLYGFVAGIYLNTINPEDAPPVTGSEIAEHLQTPGGIAGMLLVQTLILGPVIVAVSCAKGQSWKTTLALRPISGRTIGLWIGVFVVYHLATAVFERFVEVPVDPFLLMASGSRHLGLALAVTFLAPAIEEAIFRGYLFTAWRRSWLGPHGTVLVTSGLFLLMHVGQYNPLVLGQLFVLAALLGYARETTGSMIAPLVLHMLNNLFAAIVIIFLGLV